MCSVNSNETPNDTTDETDAATSLVSCHECSAPILDKKTAFRVKNEVYHQSCLTCHTCNVILSTHIFFILDGKFYCDADFSSVAVRCAVCENPIRERQVTSDRIALQVSEFESCFYQTSTVEFAVIETSKCHYHPECFRCTQCLSPLDGQPYTTDAMGNIFCIEDFHRKYAPKCHLCKEPIIPKKYESETSRIVALDRSYHPECYHCLGCESDLMHPDALCYWIESGFYCKDCRDERIDSHMDSSFKEDQ